MLQWTTDLDTGLEVIDVQHRRIVDYINELDYAHRTGNRDTTRHAIEGLLDYTITHFEFEEELQERARYPYLKAHKRVHEIFMKRIANFRNRMENGEDITSELLSMLNIWLISHIKGDDKDYVESVLKIMEERSEEHESWLSATLGRLFGAPVHAPRPGLR